MTTMDYSGELHRRKALNVTKEITRDGSPSNTEMKTDFQVKGEYEPKLLTPRPTLTYSRTGESTPEAQLRAALVNLGLVVDNTVA